MASFWPFWNAQTQQLERAQFAFNDFRFPACTSCNAEHAALENEASRVVQGLLGRQAMAANDFAILLDWLDKLRVGLWLGLHYLHRRVADVEPRMFIASRIGQTDRAVVIYASDTEEKRLTFLATGSLAFHYKPVCFTLLANHLAFFNLAQHFLISRQIGLPYPSDVRWGNWPETLYEFSPGRQEIKQPLLKRNLNPDGVALFQPIFSEVKNTLPDLYDNEHARSLSSDFKSGVGRIFIQRQKTLQPYPETPAATWIPDTIWSDSRLVRVMTRQTVNFQLYLLRLDDPGEKGLDQERREIVRSQMRATRIVSARILEKYS